MTLISTPQILQNVRYPIDATAGVCTPSIIVRHQMKRAAISHQSPKVNRRHKSSTRRLLAGKGATKRLDSGGVAGISRARRRSASESKRIRVEVYGGAVYWKRNPSEFDVEGLKIGMAWRFPVFLISFIYNYA
ncbi:hypothetical protein AB1N83_007627 [Pleurotus pulmonarius]